MKKEKFYCPRRIEIFMDMTDLEDTWRIQGEDRCCSFCGSWHPEEFLKFCKKVTEDPDINIRLSESTKGYKIYIHREGIRNAQDGAIKFYMQHLKQWVNDQGMSYKERLIIGQQIVEALRVSAVKYKKWHMEWKKKLENNMY